MLFAQLTATAVRHEWASFLVDFCRGPLKAPNNSVYRPGYTCKVFFQLIVAEGYRNFMAHTLEEKKRLLNRVRRIMGQVAAIERTLDQEGSAPKCCITFPPAGAPWMP